MNKRTRLIVSLLFVVIIILAAAITRFYIDIPDNMQNDVGQAEIVHTLEIDNAGNVIFSDGNGNVGVSSSGHITAAPEWHSLSFAGNGICIASKKIGGKMLNGCIDYEGNIIVPFVYKNISKYTVNNVVFYCAETDYDGFFILYDEKFKPVLRKSWDSCSFSDNEFTVSDKKGVYKFYVNSENIIFKSAEISGEIMDYPYNLNIYSRVLLSKLTIPMIEKMVETTEDYIEYAYTFNEEALNVENRSSFVPIFRDDARIISRKFLGISEMHIYSVSSDNGIPKYDISMNADTEITYYSESGERKTLSDNYRLAVKFSGNSENDFQAISGKFELDSPVYPEPVDDENVQETTEENINEYVIIN